MKERKKYGLKAARRAPQFSKIINSFCKRITRTHISRKAHISRVTEVVESCQMC